VTTIPAPDTAPLSSRSIDVDRLCVAARSVLDQMPDLVAEGLTGAGVERVTRHAQALVDLRGLRGLPLAAMRAHGSAVHDALMLLAGDRSLTLAVWFEDGLGIY
jgi:hypothetical protein